MYHKLTILLISAALVTMTGCAISSSLETVSDSVSGSLETFSDSSSDESNAYREDVSDYTVAYVHQGGDLDAYRLGMATLANEHGISNWEEDTFTCGSIGLGLRRAALDDDAALTFASNLFGPDDEKLRYLRAGYELTHRSFETEPAR